MLALICASILAVANAHPTAQILGPAATIAAIPATNHILILTPQAQVQLDPTLKYAQPTFQHLAPVARIESPTDQTVVYYPNDNLISHIHQKAEIKSKQLETANLTNIVNQFVTAGQTAQAQLEAFQQQLTQGLETLIQPSGGQKLEQLESNLKEPVESAVDSKKLIETARHESGRYYNVPGAPQFYSNFALTHPPLNPLYAVHPYSAVRSRSLPLKGLNVLGTKLENGNDDMLPETEKNKNARCIDSEKTPEEKYPSDSLSAQNQPVQKEQELPVDNSRFGKNIEAIENNERISEIPSESKKEEISRQSPEESNIDSISFAEVLPSGLAISGEGGLSQAKPVGSAIVGKDGIAFSAPSGTAIAGTSNYSL